MKKQALKYGWLSRQIMEIITVYSVTYYFSHSDIKSSDKTINTTLKIQFKLKKNI